MLRAERRREEEEEEDDRRVMTGRRYIHPIQGERHYRLLMGRWWVLLGVANIAFSLILLGGQ